MSCIYFLRVKKGPRHLYLLAAPGRPEISLGGRFLIVRTRILQHFLLLSDASSQTIKRVHVHADVRGRGPKMAATKAERVWTKVSATVG